MFQGAVQRPFNRGDVHGGQIPRALPGDAELFLKIGKHVMVRSGTDKDHELHDEVVVGDLHPTFVEFGLQILELTAKGGDGLELLVLEERPLFIPHPYPAHAGGFVVREQELIQFAAVEAVKKLAASPVEKIVALDLLVAV